MANKIFDTDFFYSGLDYFYRYLTRVSMLTKEHTHNYYEYFFLISGSITHIVNNRKEKLEPGDCFFMRPDDCHGYIIEQNEQFEIINMNFSVSEFERLCRYIGEDSELEKMVNVAEPCKIKLNPSQLQRLIKEHEAINFYSGQDGKTSSFVGDRDMLTTHLRFLLAEIIALFLKQRNENDTSTVQWLKTVMAKMNTRENIVKGMDALLALSGFSHGHLCLLMKEHFSVSPVEFISDLRLTYASNLLSNSNMNIIEVTHAVGYSSTSHFIKAFKQKFGLTPYRFHKVKNNRKLTDCVSDAD